VSFKSTYTSPYTSIFSSVFGASAGSLYDIYVRADGSATTIAAATNPNSASTSLNLAQLETLKASTAGLVIGFSSQGGTFDTVPATVSGGVACVDMINGATYTNVSGEHVVFDIQDNVAAAPYVFATQLSGVSTSRLERAAQGTITLNGSGKIAVFRANGDSGAGGYGIVSKNIIIGRNHSADNVTVNDAYSTDATAEIDVIGGSISSIIAAGSVGTAAQALTAHTSSKIRATSMTIQNVSQVIACTGTAAVNLSSSTVTDWELAIVAILGTGTQTISNCTFVNDGSIRVASTGKTFAGDSGFAGDCNILNSSITVSAGGGTSTLRDGTFNLTNVDYSITASTVTAINIGLGIGDTAAIKWDGGTVTRGTAGGYPFYSQYGAVQFNRVKFVTTDVIATGNAQLFRVKQPTTSPSWVRACVVEWRTSSSGKFAWFSSAATEYNFDISQNTFYGQGQILDYETTITGITAENNTFNGNGVADMDFSQIASDIGFDNNHFRNVASKPTDLNEVGAGADPLFSSPGATYNITSSSPLYHAGKDLAITTDFDGAAFHATTPSVGALEAT